MIKYTCDFCKTEGIVRYPLGKPTDWVDLNLKINWHPSNFPIHCCPSCAKRLNIPSKLPPSPSDELREHLIKIIEDVLEQREG